MRFLAVCVMSVALLVVVSTAQDQPRPIKPILFWTGSDSHQMTELFSRCGTEEEWSVIWRKHQSRDENYYPRLCPTVDFEKYMLIAIFYGQGRSDVGLYLEGIIEEKDCIRLRYREFTYQVASGSFVDTKADNSKPVAPKKYEFRSYASVILPRSKKAVMLEEGTFQDGRIDRPMIWKERAKLSAKMQ